MGQVAGKLARGLAQADEVQHPLDLGKQRAAAQMVLERDLQILPDRQRLEDSGHLELDADTLADALEALPPRDLVAVVEDLAARGGVVPQAQGAEGYLSGNLWPDP